MLKTIATAVALSTFTAPVLAAGDAPAPPPAPAPSTNIAIIVPLLFIAFVANGLSN